MTIELMKQTIREELSRMQTSLDALYSITSGIEEQQFPRVYNLRGIIMNLKSILAEVDKGIFSDMVDMGYFQEKIDSLNRDLDGFSRSYLVMTEGKYRRS